MNIRDAIEDDAAEMSAFLQQLASLGKRTSRSDLEFVLTTYINDPWKVQCVVAEDGDNTILGFQSLKRATEGNIYDVEPGWGIIGTHVRPDAARRGVGRALFAASLQAAKKAGLHKVDASIAGTNTEALAYYEAMGFRTYRMPQGTICKCLNVPA